MGLLRWQCQHFPRSILVQVRFHACEPLHTLLFTIPEFMIKCYARSLAAYILISHQLQYRRHRRAFVQIPYTHTAFGYRTACSRADSRQGNGLQRRFKVVKIGVKCTRLSCGSIISFAGVTKVSKEDSMPSPSRPFVSTTKSQARSVAADTVVETRDSTSQYRPSYLSY
jgi:hypothetical protein